MSFVKEKEKILKILLILIWFLAIIHMTAEYYHLYWLYRWFDIVTHFIGGVWLGIAGIWIWVYSGYIPNTTYSNRTALYVVLSTGIIIGLVWELFEFVVLRINGEVLPLNYMGDTALDLIVDVSGALVALFIFYIYVSKKRVQRKAPIPQEV